MIRGVIDTANGYLDRATASSFGPEASDLVNYAERLGNTAYLMFEKMAGSQSHEISHQIVQPFQSWADALEIKSDLLFRAEFTPNYELSTLGQKEFVRNIDNASQSLKDARDDISWPFLRVTVPSQALGMLPHFAVVAHELGHAIEEEISLDLIERAEIKDVAERAEQRLALIGCAYGPSGTIALNGIMKLWLNEIIADSVGFFMVGPAFYFALAGFLELASDGHGMGRSHPPAQVRRRILFRQLHAAEHGSSHADIFKKYSGVEIEEDTNSPNLLSLPDPNALFADLLLKPEMGDVKAAVCVELIPLMGQLADEVYRAVEATLRKKSPALVYSPADLDTDLRVHLEALAELIPPIERREEGKEPVPVSLAGVLNVGWAALLGKLDKIPAPDRRADDSDLNRMERLHELLLKAVELSEARTAWVAARELWKADP